MAMRFQVPQFVDIEDKIIGPLTIKQFFIYLAAILPLIPLFIFVDIFVFLAFAIPMVGAAIGFAHVKFHGKSLFTLIVHAFAYLRRGTLFIWRREGFPKPLLHTMELGALAVKESSSVSSISRSLETQGHIVQEDAPDPLAPNALE